MHVESRKANRAADQEVGSGAEGGNYRPVARLTSRSLRRAEGVHLTCWHRCFQPDRAKENSPAFQRWGSGPPDVPKSRQGRENLTLGGGAALPSLTGLVSPARPQPSVETLGYSRASCRAEGELAGSLAGPVKSENRGPKAENRNHPRATKSEAGSGAATVRASEFGLRCSVFLPSVSTHNRE